MRILVKLLPCLLLLGGCSHLPVPSSKYLPPPPVVPGPPTADPSVPVPGATICCYNTGEIATVRDTGERFEILTCNGMTILFPAMKGE